MEDQLFEIVGKIYDTAATEGDWIGLMTDIGELADDGAASILIASQKTGDARILSPHYDPQFAHECVTQWFDKDRSFATSLGAPVGKTVSIEDSGREEFLKGDFYNNLWKYSDHGVDWLRSNVIRNQDVQICFGVNPFVGRDEISSKMQKTFDLLLPHLIRAVDLQWRMHRLELDRSLSAGPERGGIVVVTGEGRVLIADQTAENILALGAPLSVKNGVLTAQDPRDSLSIQRMIASCKPKRTGYYLRGGTAHIHYPGTTSLNISIAPVPDHKCVFEIDAVGNARPAALVVLQDLSAEARIAQDRLRELFDLTQAEARVALTCLNGGTRAELAIALGISDATIRTHLSRIYEKTGVSRRPELVNLLFREGFT